MKKSWFLLVVGLLMAGAVSGQNGSAVQDRLKSTKAPSEEFIRIPSDYVLKKLAAAARASGDPSLAAFSAKTADPAIGSKRITINVEGMSLHDAIQAVANAAGMGVDYSGGKAVVKDPSAIAATPVAPEPVAPEPEPEPDVKKKRTEKVEPVSFSDISQALVFVHNGEGRGSGFIARMGGKVYVLSNQHNFKGADRIDLRAMDGRMLKPLAFEYVKTRDLVRFEVSEERVKDLASLNVSEKDPWIKQPISVYGNSAGGNVATELRGEIVGVGPNDIEIDADIVPGNSGSPVIDDQANVLGVATYLTMMKEFDKDDMRTKIYKGTRFNKTRRYGVRIPEKGWKDVPVQDFLNQTYRVEDLEHYFEAMMIVTQYWVGNEDYIAQANRLFSGYARSERSIRPPYDFHDQRVEDWLRMALRSFKTNYDEFAPNVESLSKTEKELAMSRISNGLINALKRAQETMRSYPWMSSFLEDSTVPLEQLGDELINVLETTKRSSVFFQKNRSKKL